MSWKLPELAPAPPSDLQSLLRKLITDRDLSTVPLILDELQGIGRDEDAKKLKYDLGELAKTTLMKSPHTPAGRQWEYFRDEAVCYFWFDLFDMQASLSALQPLIMEPPVIEREYLVWDGRSSLPLSTLRPPNATNIRFDGVTTSGNNAWDHANSIQAPPENPDLLHSDLLSEPQVQEVLNFYREHIRNGTMPSESVYSPGTDAHREEIRLARLVAENPDDVR
jgi:hypothetical protein